nr:protein unc-13 homolog [Ipomoea batatas]
MPPGAVSLDDVDLDQVSVDYVLNCVKKGGMLELAEAIRDYHDSTLFPSVNNAGATTEFFLATNPESSGSPPRRAPPPVPVATPLPILPTLSTEEPLDSMSVEEQSPLTKSQSLTSQVRELTVDDIDDFDDDLDEVDSRRYSRRVLNDATDLVPGLPSFATGISDDDLRETAYEILLAAAGASGGLIVPSKEKKKDRKSKLMQKLGRSKSEHSAARPQRSHGLVSLLETMRVQMELNMLEEGLVNHPAVGFGESGRKANELRALLAKIEESESLPPPAADLQRSECLRSLREVAIPLAERPARGDLTGEVCHWADGYHLNVKLYEKLLLSIFDVLDEGKLTEFVITSEQGILLHAIEQLKKIPLKEQRGPQERLHLKSLQRRIESEKGYQELSFLQSFLLPVKKWADKQLEDYHLCYAEGSALMEATVVVAMLARRLLLEEPGLAMQAIPDTDSEQIEFYISSSTKYAFARMLQDVDTLSDATHEHPLALLAEQTKKLLQKDRTIYMPILKQRHHNAAAVSASLVHKLYGVKLKPFLDSAEHLTEDIVAVFPAADSLEQYIIEIIVQTCEEGAADAYCRKLNLYKDWVPVSPQQRYGSSIIEVYRIVEETVDQLFALGVPMRSAELNSLIRGIDNAFQLYAQHVVSKLANKEDIVPPIPILTRYSREHGIKAFVKKELRDSKLSDSRKFGDVNILATSTLCIQLNTLHYAISQLNKLEDSIWEQWSKIKPHDKITKKSTDVTKSSVQKNTFDGSRKDINAAIDQICEFTGTKIIFWDLREPFIDNLYKPTAAQSRFEALMDTLDTVLSELCSVIMEPLRDRVVTGLLQASLDGLLRVILDGGPSRIFYPSDAKLLEEDLEILKEFYISGGDGLPRGVVENQVAHLREVVKLHGYETRELIEDLKSASEVEMQGGRSKLGADTKTLLRILCHRGDSEASQFVKKQFKIPKSA